MRFLARAWRWGDKWLVHVWLGIPLLAAFIGFVGGGLDQYQDFGDHAVKAPRIERRGLIKTTDIRGRQAVLITNDEKIPVTCTVPSNSYCIKKITPIKASVKIINYRGYNVIIDLVSDDGRHLIKEEEEVKSILNAMPSYRKDGTSDRVIWMVFSSFLLVIPFMIAIPIFRWIGRRNLKKKGEA